MFTGKGFLPYGLSLFSLISVDGSTIVGDSQNADNKDKETKVEQLKTNTQKLFNSKTKTLDNGLKVIVVE
ncbi:MAG: hypothetical protein LBQ43_03185, partial [Holosporales bacterium]|nr:hypothetical protein [Holosporales bacterium]